MTRQLSFREADMTMVLPGSWVSVPLADDEKAKREINNLVKRQVGMNDRLARVRRDAREQLRGMASAAKTAGAFRVGLSLEILPGVPFPAAMIMDYRDWPAGATAAPAAEATDGEDAADEAVTARLAAAFPNAEQLPLDCGPTARTSLTASLKVGAESTQDVKLEYWLPVPGGEKLLHITVDVPSPGDPALYTELFDAIVDSVRWFPVASGSAQ
ncbi:hypothetical protein ACFVWR_08795 [Leifsonia sp. NPDC058292]|uniref:hypothetical protein n=1 Tax=Leifsonia sp. NPDC058292 TaxID=3346428 RepID=UPI0036D9AC71